MRELLVVLVALVGIGCLEALYYLLRHVGERKRETLRRRLRDLGQGLAPPGARTLLRANTLSNVPWLDQLLRDLPLLENLRQLLQQADMQISVLRLLVISGACALGALLLSVGMRAPLLVTSVVALLFASTPLLWVMLRVARRSEKLSRQLPDALDMMTRSLRAGHAIPGALQFVASEMAEPINLEFGRVYEEQRLGRSLEESVVNLVHRLPRNQDLKIFAVSVLVQRETGGNLTEILEGIAHTIRARYQFYGKLRALTAEGRLSGIVLGSLPLLMLAFLMLVQPEYLRPLMTNATGHLILLYALVSWLLGILAMAKLARVEM